MATATITLKKGTTAEWTESKRVLDDGELGLETTTSGHRIIRIGNGSTEFMSLPVAFDIEEVREIKTECLCCQFSCPHLRFFVAIARLSLTLSVVLLATSSPSI
jgi:hypothetical protein